ncbi:putative leader peptide [Streptomyces himalayensis]|nr:putative leader peptide [Streptomyces himalayensis]
MYPGVFLTARRHVDLVRLSASLCRPRMACVDAARTSKSRA